MAQRKISEFTRFVVEQPVEIEPGTTLTPGRYSGRRLQTLHVGRSEHHDAPAEYEIELTSNQLKDCGCEVSEQFVSETIRITRQVEAGEITAA